MARRFLSILLFSLLLVSPATAATTQTATPDDRPAECNQPLGDGVSLCSSSYSSENETATVTLYVDQSKAVSLTDGLGWSDEEKNEIPRLTGVVLEPGKNTLQLEATQWKNKVVLMLGTSESLIPIRVVDGQAGDLGLVPGTPQTSDPLVAGGTVFLMFAAGFPLAVLFVRRHMGGIFDEW